MVGIQFDVIVFGQCYVYYEYQVQGYGQQVVLVDVEGGLVLCFEQKVVCVEWEQVDEQCECYDNDCCEGEYRLKGVYWGLLWFQYVYGVVFFGRLKGQLIDFG